ncbi:hypothetical protein [Enterobacter sp. R1(2018)]|uniref:hypothetical protein n=1 Tax=Enterobacter sp. R1(2018) TaxID=2447891 RepID=UPI000EB4F881|nr:hypothetical protein [Enterobacter sp. R1(2018)]RKQ38403.1 hypothetical protein D8M09_17520 [Enterobacter sp. R1(2018)]
MKMEIPGNLEDYFTEYENEIGEKVYKSNRESLRALVEIRNLKTQEVIASGGNPHQASLDLNDQFEEFLSLAPPMAQVAIYETYVEELNASTAEFIDTTNRINAETMAAEERNNLMGQLIGVIVIVIIAAVVISTF